VSTRAAIAKPLGDGWTGRYHHFDGYPGGLGMDLLDLYDGHFAKDLEVMTKTLIEDHPAGWSQAGNSADWARATPGFDGAGPKCYCHGGRNEGEMQKAVCTCPAPGSECDALFLEWAYVLTPRGIMVYASQAGERTDAAKPTPYLHVVKGLVEWGDVHAMANMERG